MQDESVRCWTLGKAPTAVTGLSNVSAINCGRNSCCALLANKTLACWGANASGELGAGSSVIESATPLAVVGLTNVLEVQVGDLHACARLENGAVYCWGDNYSGQVSGDTSVANSRIPLLMTGLPFANSLTAGGSHTCATVNKPDPSPVYGNTLCWGANGLQQSGSASFANFKEPSSHVRAHLLSAGHAHNCATDSLGVVYCWADNSSGQLGIGYKNQMDSGFPSPLSASPITQIALGDGHSCVLHQDGTAQCWGLHTAGQLGCGTNFSTTKPLPVYLTVN
jgi:alpha-tubulin suppressor-like RCC1 family protein